MRSSGDTDNLWKMRPVLDALQTALKSVVDPEECHSIDEMMVPFTGQSGVKQYVRSKPKSICVGILLHGVHICVHAAKSPKMVLQKKSYVYHSNLCVM